jgi:uncharacterized protein DUF87
MSFIVPEKIFEQHTIILGKTRSGKSSVARLCVEHLLDRGEPVCILDPKGDWWGLKSSANGKRAGYPVIIFGGEHADLPLNSKSGAAVAELVATGNRPCIIDLGGWMPGARTEFFVDFASTYFRITRGRRWLVIDEVHNFAPQGKVLDPQSGKMLHWANRLANEGLGKGVSLISCSQRPQKVAKDFVTAAETLIALRVIHPLDRRATQEWIDGCGDPAKGKAVLETLAANKRGEGWVWSPEIDFGPQKIQFPMFGTYDSFKPQDSHLPAKLKGWADVDLANVKSKLEAVVKEAEANDPATLRARIRELEKQRPSAPTKPAAPAPDPRALREMERKMVAVQAEAKRLKVAGEMLSQRLTELAQKALSQFSVAISEPKKASAKVSPSFHALTPRVSPVIARPRSALSAESNGNGDDELPRRQADILRVLSEFEAIGRSPVQKNWIAARAGVSHSSGGYFNNLGSLHTRGLIAYDGRGGVSLTPEGRAATPHFEAPTTTDEMLASCMGILDRRKQDILKAVHEAHPNAIAKSDLAEMVGVSSTSGGYFNNLGALRSAGMIEYASGGVRCADWLFL